MTVMVKLLGAVLLVGSMAAASVAQMRRVAVALATVRAWQRFLDGVRHEILTSGATLSSVLAPLRREDALRHRLLGGRRILCRESSARGLLRALCCEAATLLPADAPATATLRTLGETFDQAVSGEQIVQYLDTLLAELAALEEDLETQHRQRCRAHAALYICGALCVVLMLW